MSKIVDKLGNAKKRLGVDGIIVVLFLCVVAVVLCSLFKDSINTFMSGIMTQLTDKAKLIIDTTSSTLK